MTIRLLAVFFCLISASISASGQITIDTFAGGHVPSGVSAQNVALGIIAGVTRDPKGNLVFCDSTTNVIRRINADGTIQTIAGTGIPGYGGDGGPAVSALLNNPAFAKYDAAGNLYFADNGSFRIRRIDTSGIITTLAGTGIQGTLGADGPATQAQVSFIADLAIDKSGYVYFAEGGYSVNNQGNPAEVRRLTPSGRIEMYAGCATCSEVDGVPATQFGFSFVLALAIDQTGNLYFSDQSHVLRISADGVVHDFAGFGDPSTPNNGNGGQALKAPPSNFRQLAVDSSGNLYTEETSNQEGGNGGFIIRRIGSDGVINVVAGTFDPSADSQTGPALQVVLSPAAGLGLTADANGVVTFVDDLSLGQLTTKATIQTVAGSLPMTAPDGTAALSAWFIQPNSIAFNRAGELYVGQNCIIQKVASDGLLATIAGTGQCSYTSPTGPALTTKLTPVTSMVVDSHNQVYFVDFLGSLYVVSSAGVISKIADITPGAGAFTKLAIDSHDRVYFLSLFYVFGRVAPGAAPQIIDSIYAGYGLTVDDSDNIYICCDQTNAIHLYSPDLVATVLHSTGLGAGGGQYAIAVDSSSDIWQSEPLRGLWKGNLPFGAPCCDNGAGPLANYGDGGPAESANISPSAIAFAPNGDLYMLDANAGRVRRIHGSTPSAKPVISSGGIVNALSYTGTAIAPGELISIFGSNFGPSGLDVYKLQNSFVPRAMNNVHVYFANPHWMGNVTARTNNQINVFVPYEVANLTSVQVIVDVDGVTSDPVTVPVAPSAVGLATHDGSGSGQGAILNQDGSLNSHANPAARGSVVVMFGTGEGVTTPALPDGALVISTPYPKPGTVTVAFGGQNAIIQYAGAAPFLPTGVLQINATIPTDVTPGDVPIKVSIDGISTTRTVTVAVR